MTDKRYLCIHGHFYQPPRENAWLETIEPQDSAAPYHDWNARVTAECYEPNTAARILDGDGRIVRLVNNYSRMSFNFGPTLLKWLEESEPAVYADILDADARSADRFGGHGSAMAQAFNHQILPLANDRDRRTQILWGLRDFEHRFARAAEGMWLPETAVNNPTLEDLAAAGVAFTILAPHQARRSRRIGETEWADHNLHPVDTTRPYRVNLASGRSIVVFFYDGATSRAVAFEGILQQGEQFAERLVGALGEGEGPRLEHIATDGETYGHHHRRGEMALAYALDHVESEKLAELVNYGLYLERFPADHEAEIVENTSWSCVHGIERWRTDCGCNSGRPGWNQAWRAPLLAALDWLRDSVEQPFEVAAAELFRDPWEARDSYIDVILDREPGNVSSYLQRFGCEFGEGFDVVRALSLMELQRNAMLMYTSCGWFFDDISGIETVQVIQYAGRVVQLARDVLGLDLEREFSSRLAEARSNVPEQGDGRQVYERHVKGSMVDLRGVAAHFAINSLFEPEAANGARRTVYPFREEILERELVESGTMKMLLGRSRLISAVTTEEADVTYGILHFGDHNVSAGVRNYQGVEAYAAMAHDLREAFTRADYPQIVRLQERHFGERTYSLRSLFRDEQRHVLTKVIANTMQSIGESYREIYLQNQPLMHSLEQFAFPLPAGLRVAAETVLHNDAVTELEQPLPDFGEVERLVNEASQWGVRLDASEQFRFAYEVALERMAIALERTPDDLQLLESLRLASEISGRAEHELDRWQVQKAYYAVAHSSVYALAEARASRGDREADEWLLHFRALGDWLTVVLPSNGE
ncbi:MAG: DUF3536 domain-containing protein [Dehalococcoidia bacterium]|nr:DUF3536 domain-containing protein [Dehalococcoidia bacterium]